MADVAHLAVAKGALSVEVGGERYPVRDGHAVIRGQYADEVLRVGDAVRGDLTTFAGPSGGACPRCRRTRFAWETSCPRCGEAA